MQPTITVTHLRPGMKALANSLEMLTKRRVLIGIPATNAQERAAQLVTLAATMRGKARKRTLGLAAKSLVNNAELAYIHSNGSPLHNIPPRPFIEPSLNDKENQRMILPELQLAAKAALKGDEALVVRQLNLAGIVAENCVKAWWVNPKNGWPPNKPATIRAKGSSRPLIDTSALRQSITHVLAGAK
jgi:hypothetical protein